MKTDKAQRAVAWLTAAATNETLLKLCQRNAWFCYPIENGDVRAFVVKRDETAWVIVCDYGNVHWLADDQAWLKDGDGTGRVHFGAFCDANAVFDDLERRLQKVGLHNRLYFAGHGMGGALAAILARRIIGVDAVFLFGVPRFADSRYCVLYPHRVERYSIAGDPVACIWTLARGWRHLGNCRLLTGETRLRTRKIWWRLWLRLKNLYDTANQGAKIQQIQRRNLEMHAITRYADFVDRLRF